MNIIRISLAAALLLPAAAIAAAQNDLREFRVGMPVSALPQSGYGAFACAADPSKELPNWNAYKSCPASSDGNRAISFRYDDEALGGQGNGNTRVAGQPVELALLINNSSEVAGIEIDTDPHTRLYMHKKAFLFGLQVRERFGQSGWSCQKLAPTPTEQPVGGVFIHEHCEKITDSRHFVMDRQLFRDPSKNLQDFIDATQVTIRGAG